MLQHEGFLCLIGPQQDQTQRGKGMDCSKEEKQPFQLLVELLLLQQAIPKEHQKSFESLALELTATGSAGAEAELSWAYTVRV